MDIGNWLLENNGKWMITFIGSFIELIRAYQQILCFGLIETLPPRGQATSLTEDHYYLLKALLREMVESLPSDPCRLKTLLRDSITRTFLEIESLLKIFILKYIVYLI